MFCIPFGVRPLKYYGTDYPAFICIFFIICRLFRVLCMWVVYLKNFFFWRISQWNNSRTTNSQNLGCKRISTRPTRKMGHFPGNCSKKCLTPAFKLPISPREIWHPHDLTKSTEHAASARSKTDAKILPRPLSLLTRSSSTNLFSQVFDTYCIHV